MFRKILNKLRGDKADSSIVSLVIMIPLVIGLMITILDSSFYLANRGQIAGMAKDAARTVAIMGGNGNGTLSTPIEAKYGLTKAETCGKVSKTGIAKDAKKSDSTAIECNVMLGLESARGLLQVTVNSVECTPSLLGSVGARASCEVKWNYEGLPGSGMTLLRNAASSPSKKGDPALAGEQVTSGSAESEVNMTGITMVPRA